MAAGESATMAAAPQEADAIVSGMLRYSELLGDRFPELAADEDFSVIRDILEDSQEGMVGRELELLSAVAGLIERFRGMENAFLMPPTGEGELFAILKPLVDNYVARGGTSYRIEIALDNPLGETAMDAVRDIRDVLASTEASDAKGEAVVSGFTAVFTDIQDVMARDQVRIYCFILMGIFAVLLLMLRSVVAPIYLIGTVVLSFTCTLGLTNLFFEAVYRVDKLSWMLPIFMFVFLVALGIDYSIFLFGRIKEEVARHGVREGVHVAVAATGAIITSAGIILAGTFAGMMVGDMMLLKQLGFAVSVGVLIDTFVVRTVLDPALAAAFGRWTWWPGGVPRLLESAQASPAPATSSGD
jgi:RND superfamily putative drug exporter